MTSKTHAILGGGVAGASAAEALRGAGFDDHIVLVGDEPPPSAWANQAVTPHDTAKRCSEFVQRFYDWYVSRANRAEVGKYQGFLSDLALDERDRSLATS